MAIWGKLVGGALGFAFGGGPIGALFGAAAGHAYDQHMEALELEQLHKLEVKSTFKPTGPDPAAFTNGVIVLGAKMAKVDGKVTRAKIDAFKRAFSIKPADETKIGRIFDQARRSSEGYEPYAFALAQKYSSHPSVLEEILSGLFIIAAADNETISPAAAAFLKNVAYSFNYGPEDFKRIAARTGVKLPSDESTREAQRGTKNDPLDESYSILGITSTTSNDDIKSAYRTLIRQHHPDKLIAEGMPPEFIATANEKMKRINVAYDAVCKVRGIK